MMRQLPGLAAVAVALALAGAALAEPRAITVRGEGVAAAVPDTAEIIAGIEARADTAADALGEASRVVERLLAALREAGIAASDVRTRGLRVTPIHDRPDGRAEMPRIVGYAALHELAVTVRDLDALGPLLDRLVQGGANRLGGVQFSIARADALLADVRRRAVADARAKAEAYAAAAGAQLGVVLRLQEEGEDVPRPMMMAAEMRAAAVPVAPGTEEVRAVVSVTWQLH